MNNVFLVKKGTTNWSVNTAVSPFACREGDTIERIAPPEKLYFISQYTISEIQKEVLLVLETLMVATGNQIFDMLQAKGYTQTAVQGALTSLFKGGYIHKLQFKDANNGLSSYRIYMLSSVRGRALFKSVYERAPQKVRYAEQIVCPALLKNYLAINQLTTNTANIAKEYLRAEMYVKKNLLFPDTKLSVRGSFVTTEDKLVFCEGIRRDHVEPLSRFKDLRRIITAYKSKRVTPNLVLEPTLVIIAEDKSHMLELANIARRVFKKESVYLTYDTAILKENFENAFLKVDDNAKLEAVS